MLQVVEDPFTKELLRTVAMRFAAIALGGAVTITTPWTVVFGSIQRAESTLGLTCSGVHGERNGRKIQCSRTTFANDERRKRRTLFERFLSFVERKFATKRDAHQSAIRLFWVRLKKVPRFSFPFAEFLTRFAICLTFQSSFCGRLLPVSICLECPRRVLRFGLSLSL